MDKVTDIENKIQQLIQYLLVKVSLRDWHAVADAAMDIRELEAKKQVYLEEGFGERD